MNPRPKVLARLLEAIGDPDPVDGLTHTFYRYPARFSPLFARAVIEAFTEPGDVVIDPFMGGGTTLVEGRVLGRTCIGLDINALAVFVAKAKTTLITDSDVDRLKAWGTRLPRTLRRGMRRPSHPRASLGCESNIDGRATWALRKLIAVALNSFGPLTNGRQRRLARTAVLKTAQWALDCRSDSPSAESFRRQLVLSLEHVLAGALEFRSAVRRVARPSDRSGPPKILCLNRSAQGIHEDSRLRNYPPPSLIVTSPPYPGVHVLYHRWQIHGRKETAAPFWITNSLDGNGASYYTFGDREEIGLARYFRQVRATFSSLARVASEETLLVQLVAFADPRWQLKSYLAALRESGWLELRFPKASNAADGRIWRGVPNRKWYARTRGDIPASREVVLFHRLSSETPATARVRRPPPNHQRG